MRKHFHAVIFNRNGVLQQIGISSWVFFVLGVFCLTDVRRAGNMSLICRQWSGAQHPECRHVMPARFRKDDVITNYIVLF